MANTKPEESKKIKRDKSKSYRPIHQDDLYIEESFFTIFLHVRDFVREVNGWVPKELAKIAHLSNTHSNLSERKRIANKVNSIVQEIETKLQEEISKYAEMCDDLGLDSTAISSSRNKPYTFSIPTNAATRTYLGWLEMMNDYCRNIATLHIHQQLTDKVVATEPFIVRRYIKNKIKELQKYVNDQEYRVSPIVKRKSKSKVEAPEATVSAEPVE